MEISIKNNWDKGKAISNYDLGFLNYQKGNDSVAIAFCNKAISIWDDMEHSSTNYPKLFITGSKAKPTGLIGVIYLRQGKYMEANEYLNKALQISLYAGDKVYASNCYLNLAVLCTQQNNYSKALTYYFKGLHIEEELNNQENIAKTFMNIGNIYKYQNQDSSALNYFTQALKVARSLDNPYVLGFTLGAMGSIYTKLKDYPKAITYYEQAIALSEKVVNRDGPVMLSANLSNLGNAYNFQHQPEKALDYYLRSLKIGKEINRQSTIAVGLTTSPPCMFLIPNFRHHREKTKKATFWPKIIYLKRLLLIPS